MEEYEQRVAGERSKYIEHEEMGVYTFKYPTLCKLKDNAVFSVMFTKEGSLNFQEQCDKEYHVDLTRDEVRLLASELLELIGD